MPGEGMEMKSLAGWLAGVSCVLRWLMVIEASQDATGGKLSLSVATFSAAMPAPEVRTDPLLRFC